MFKYPIYLQDDELSCGSYCIKMLLKYYGREEDISTIKKRARQTSTGTSIKGLVEALKSYHIEAKAYHASIEDLEENHLFPSIIHITKGELGHFCVLYDINKEGYVVGDPAIGRVTYEKEMFLQVYSENVIMITHIGRYDDYHHLSFSMYLKDMVYKYHRDISKLMVMSLIISLLDYIVVSLYSYMIDHLRVSTSFKISISLLIAYLLVSIGKMSLVYYKEKRVIDWRRRLDQRTVLSSMMNVMHLDEQVFYQGEGMIHAKLRDLSALTDYCIDLFIGLFVDGVMVLFMIVALLILSPYMSLILAVLIGMGLFIYFMSKKWLNRSRSALMADHEVSDTLWSYLTGRYIGRVYFHTRDWKNRLKFRYEKKLEADQKQSLCGLSLSTGIHFFSVLSTALVFMLGLTLYHRHVMSLGHVFMASMIMELLLPSVIDLATLISGYLPKTLLFEHLKAFSERQEEYGEHFDEKITSITLDNVSYGYGYHPDVLSHVSLVIKKPIFVMGENGSGKSTLLKLISGENSDYRGDIYLNNTSLTKLNRSCLYEHILYVKEEETFMEGTVHENLMNEDLTKIENILKLLEAESMMEMMGLAIKSDGFPLSQGQRQLLALTRALLKEADVYCLDESFSHIYERKAKRIIKRLFHTYKSTLFVIVTHQTKLVNSDYDCVIMGAEK